MAHVDRGDKDERKGAWKPRHVRKDRRSQEFEKELGTYMAPVLKYFQGLREEVYGEPSYMHGPRGSSYTSVKFRVG